MILNLGEICSRASTLAGGRNDWQLSEASFWANVALSEVGSRTGYTAKEALAVSSTTSGENRVAFPGDFDYPLGITLYVGSTSTGTTSHTTSIVPLLPRDANWVDAQALTSGQPSDYVYFGTFIELYPSPNSAYSLQLRYMTKAPTLVASRDTPNLDERWHPGVVFKTAEFLEASRANVEGEAIARNRYLNFMAVTPTDQSLKQRDRRGMNVRYVKKLD
jgi:hypothetical protein